MGIWKKSKTGRFSEEELAMFLWIQHKAAPFTTNWTNTVVFSGKVTRKVLSTPSIMGGFVDLCQSLQCDTSQDKQMKLSFPPSDGHSFFPRISNRMEAE
jgi:hypothetical protein